MYYKNIFWLPNFSDEDPFAFNEDLSTDDELDSDKFIIIEGGSNKQERCLVDKAGYKLTEECYTRDRVSLNTYHLCRLTLFFIIALYTLYVLLL